MLRKALLFMITGMCVVLCPVRGFAASVTLPAFSRWVWDIGAAYDDVDLNGYELRIMNNGADDGSGPNVFNIGDITGAGTSSIVNAYATDAVNPYQATIASVNIEGDFLEQTGSSTNTNTVVVDVTGSFSARNLTLTSTHVSGGVVKMTVNGDFQTSGVVNITAGTPRTELHLKGASISSASGFRLDDSSGILASLYIDGTVDQVVTGAVYGFSAAEGYLNVGSGATTSKVTFQSAIGASNKTLAAINISGSGDKIFNSTVSSMMLSIYTTSTIYFNDNLRLYSQLYTSADPVIVLEDGKWINVTGGITTATADKGTLRLLGSYDSGYTLTGNIGATGALKKIELAGTGKTVNVNGNVNINQLSLGNNTMNVTGNYSQDANGVFSAVIGSVSDYGHLIASGSVTLPSSTTVQVDVTGTLPGTSTTIDLITCSNTSGVSLPSTLVVTGTTRTASLRLDASHLYLDFAAGFIPFAPRVSGGNNNAAALSLDGIGLSASGDMGNVISTLGGLSSSDVDSAIQTMLPDISGFNPQVPVQLLEQFVGVQMDHLGGVSQLALNDTATPTGMSAGDQPAGFMTWFKAFGTAAHQDPRGSSQGYNLSNGGLAIGIERDLSDRFKAGVALGSTQSWVRGKDNTSRTDIETTQVSLYGGYKSLVSPWYLNGALSYNYNEYGGSREIHVGPSDNRIANADYIGHLFGASMEAGYGIKLGKKAVFTPLASLSYTQLHVPGYAEADAGDLSLKVDAQNYSNLRAGIGGKLETVKEYAFGQVTPEVHAKYLYDIMNDRQNMVASFAGGGTAFSVQGYDPARSGADIGTSLTLLTKKDVTVSLQYDFELREDYYAHTGFLNVGYKF